jgi:hypothetical protein
MRGPRELVETHPGGSRGPRQSDAQGGLVIAEQSDIAVVSRGERSVSAALGAGRR